MCMQYRTVVSLLVVCVLGCASASRAAANATDAYQRHVRTQCGFARYPSLCVQLLREGQELDVVSALLTRTIHETQEANFYPLGNSEDQHALAAVTGSCHELMAMSLRRLNQSLLAIKESPVKNKHDVQAWLSAALTFQQTCKDLARGVGLSGNLVAEQISDNMDSLSRLISNPLALVNRINSVEKKNGWQSRRRAAEEGMFPDWVSPKERKLLQASTVRANAVVAKDGTGDYATISEAIQAAPGSRFVIYVKSGVYREKIHTNKDGITLIGDGKYSTIIVGDDSVKGGASMPGSATFTITGDGFIARDIGFQNTAGPQGEQALALTVSSDHSVFYRCSILGYQDTLYALALRQFYRECDIYGTIDFIFGNAAAVFQSCNLVLRRPRSGSYNVILANGRSDPGQTTGFSLHKCKIAAGTDFSAVKNSVKSYLGRPWKEYSRSVIMETAIDDAIAPRGWVEWPGAGSSSLQTLYFAEYSNVGPGAVTSSRVQWPGFHVLGAQEAVKFTVGNFIGGSWLPSTGVPFISGL